MQHPYLDGTFIAASIALMTIAVLVLVAAWARLDNHLEDRRERRLDAKADREIRKELVNAAEHAYVPTQRHTS